MIRQQVGRRSRQTTLSGSGTVPGRLRVRLALCTFAILVLELAIIRWMSGQVRIVAYFQNLVLLAAFLGMGLGVALGRRHPGLVHCALPTLAVLSALLAFAGPLGLMHVEFPDPSIALWGGESQSTLAGFFGATLLVTGLFWLVAAVFLFAGSAVGWLFHEMPALDAYTADILGSLLGVGAMATAAALDTTPPVWLLLGGLPLLAFTRRLSSLVALGAVAVMAFVSIEGARFSPYNRIDVEPLTDGGRTDEWRMRVNRDFHQDILNLSNEAVGRSRDDGSRRMLQRVYELPFALGAGGRALVVGAGTGNDVMAALRQGYSEVHAIEIDHEILRVGHELHPEHPYSDVRVRAVVNDARAYFEQNPDERFDVVCYGLLDSHAMFSAMSSLRLDNYVYTIEGLRAGWEHVDEDGILSVSFSVYAGQWIGDRLLGVIREATGQDPVIVAHGMNYAVTYLVGRKLDPRRVPSDLGPVYREFEAGTVRLTTDDWPFLYLEPGAVPYTYLAVLSLLLGTAALAVRGTYGRALFSAQRFDVPMFLLGAAFMLLETRMVTELSLLFGSTWIVNVSVFAGILLMIVGGNAWVARRAPRNIGPWYVPLFASLALTWAVGAGTLNQLELEPRLLLAGVTFASPVLFAAVIFASLLRQAPDPSAALGSNLLGAVLGGFVEYSSMALGLRAMTVLALLFYAASLLVWHTRGRAAALARTGGRI